MITASHRCCDCQVWSYLRLRVNQCGCAGRSGDLACKGLTTHLQDAWAAGRAESPSCADEAAFAAAIGPIVAMNVWFRFSEEDWDLQMPFPILGGQAPEPVSGLVGALSTARREAQASR